MQTTTQHDSVSADYYISYNFYLLDGFEIESEVTTALYVHSIRAVTGSV